MTDEPVHGETVIDGLRYHFVEAGVPDGRAGGSERDLVVLLHGFPDFWYGWRRQLPALADAGYHVVAPDMRGYNRTEAPAGVGAYDVEHLAADATALVRDRGYDRAHLVGHDWGGAVAWRVGQRDPDWLDRLAVLNAPHPAAFQRELRDGDQLARSWYALFFQLPRLPEWLLGVDDCEAVARSLLEDSAPDAFTDADVDRYREAFADPATRRAAVDYYRAAFRRGVRESLSALPGVSRPSGPAPDAPISVPTLLLWGVADRALSPCLTVGLEQWVPDLRVERLPGASHWVQADAPARVSEELVAFVEAA